MYGARAINRLPIKKRWNPQTESLAAAANRQIQRSANARLRRMTGGLPYQRNVLYRAPRSTQLQEVKCFDQSIAGAVGLSAFGGTASAEPAAAFQGITEVNCITQGATVANRIGNKIMIKSIDMRLSFSGIATTLATLRLMLIYDRQPNGAFPAITDILLSQPAGAAKALSGLNIANKSRFQVIRDQWLDMDPASNLIELVHWYCKGRWESEFGANAGNIGDFRTGALLLVAFVAAAGGAGPVTFMSSECRIRYYD